MDDLELLVDGVPITEVPNIPREMTILDTDRKFAQGSGVEITEFTPEQVEHLAALAEVWGFLKYHHPRVGRGERGGHGPDAGETRMQIQARVNNLFKHSQPRSYNGVLTSPLFGQPTSFSGGRTIRLSLNLDF